MAEPALGVLPPPRSPLNTAPPPVATARPTPPMQGDGSDNMAAFVTKGKGIIRDLVEMATMRRDKATELSAIAGQLTDLIEEEVQAPTPTGTMDQPDGMDQGLPIPRTPLRSPMMTPPPGMPPQGMG